MSTDPLRGYNHDLFTVCWQEAWLLILCLQNQQLDAQRTSKLIWLTVVKRENSLPPLSLRVHGFSIIPRHKEGRGRLVRRLITLIFAGLTARPFFAAELPRSKSGSSALPYSIGLPRILRKRGRVPAYALDVVCCSLASSFVFTSVV